MRNRFPVTINTEIAEVRQPVEARRLILSVGMAGFPRVVIALLPPFSFANFNSTTLLASSCMDLAANTYSTECPISYKFKLN